MRSRRVAIIGHSAAGKSASLRQLGIDEHAGDMDRVLGTADCPPLEEALKWLSGDETPAVVAVSNHEEMLKAMQQEKLAGATPSFANFTMVYLHVPKDKIEERLRQPTDGGHIRESNGVEYTLQHYDCLHELYCSLADVTVECSWKSVEAVAGELDGIASGN
jgi:shikimate kinase